MCFRGGGVDSRVCHLTVSRGCRENWQSLSFLKVFVFQTVDSIEEKEIPLRRAKRQCLSFHSSVIIKRYYHLGKEVSP